MNPDAINNLGTMYKTGQRGTADLRKACEQFRQASELGHPPAMFNFAHCYFDDRRTTDLDEKAAVELMQRAAQRGQNDASRFLKAHKLG